MKTLGPIGPRAAGERDEASWIRIDFDRLDPDLDPGGQKCPTKKKKREEISFFEVLFGGL